MLTCWAVTARPDTGDYIAQETAAKAARRGIWQRTVEEPAMCREKHE